jgi:hypothetical protein
LDFGEQDEVAENISGEALLDKGEEEEEAL